MNFVLLWLFGLLAIASIVMIAAWGRAAHALYPAAQSNPKGMWWDRSFVIATALTVHAVGMAISTGYRVWDMLHGIGASGSEVGFLATTLILLGISKIGFVWGGSIDAETYRARWSWWAFLYALIMWGLFCAMWAAGYFS